jgi:hypothetical protein
MTMLQHTGNFLSIIYQQRIMWRHWSIFPDLAPVEFYLFPLLKLTLTGWSYFVLLTELWMRRMSWKFSQNGYIFNNFLVAGRSVYIHKWTFWRNCILIDCIVLYVSDLKCFQQHFEATIYGVLYFLAESFARDLW